MSLRMSAVLAVVVALAAPPAAARATEMIQGTWEGELGTIEVTPTGPGRWVGTVTEKGMRYCAPPVGKQIWRVNAKTDARAYTGTHTWVRLLTCESMGEGPATYALDYSADGQPEMKLCITNPEQLLDTRCSVYRQPVNALVVRDEDGCTRLRQGQWRIARFSGHRLELHTNSQVPQGTPPVEISRKETDFPIGNVKIGAATCRKKSGRWGIVNPVSVHVASVGLNNDGQPRRKGPEPDLSEGWGIGIKAAALGALEVQMQQCDKGRFWATMKELNDVPIPYLKYAVDIGKYVAGKFLPEDKVDCVDYGVQQLKLRVGRRGRLKVGRGFEVPAEQVVTSSSADGTTYHWRTSVNDPAIKSMRRRRR